MIGVVDIGLGNAGSVVTMLRQVGAEAFATGAPQELAEAEALVLPGVGAFDEAVTRLRDTGLWEVLLKRVRNDGVPLLGICLGMQLLCDGSEEGELPGLGLIPGRTVRFRFPAERRDLRLPHMGWSVAEPVGEQPLFEGLQESRFYFVHSYHVVPKREEDRLCETPYGYRFVSGIRRDRIVGVQFHPEKSHAYGKRLLANFCEAVTG